MAGRRKETELWGNKAQVRSYFFPYSPTLPRSVLILGLRKQHWECWWSVAWLRNSRETTSYLVPAQLSPAQLPLRRSSQKDRKLSYTHLRKLAKVWGERFPNHQQQHQQKRHFSYSSYEPLFCMDHVHLFLLEMPLGSSIFQTFFFYDNEYFQFISCLFDWSFVSFCGFFLCTEFFP